MYRRQRHKQPSFSLPYDPVQLRDREHGRIQDRRCKEGRVFAALHKMEINPKDTIDSIARRMEPEIAMDYRKMFEEKSETPAQCRYVAAFEQVASSIERMKKYLTPQLPILQYVKIKRS